MKRELTGRHVLAITLCAFGVIVGVNLFMAFKAVGTFPGLEVANSYVASQSFDRERVAQEQLGWRIEVDHDGQNLTLEVLDANGNHPLIRDFSAVIGRPTHVREDRALDLDHDGRVFRAPLELGPGSWIIHVNATAADGTAFRQRLTHVMRAARG